MTKTRRTRAAIAIASVCALTGPSPLGPPIAQAQGALVTVLVQSSDGRCLAVTPPSNAAGSSAEPGRGWRVIVEACQGRRSERWGQLVGDFQFFVFSPGVCAAEVQSGAGLELVSCESGRAVLVNRSERPEVSDTEFRVGDRCMTAPAPGGSPSVTLAACDGRPAQRWRVSPSR